MEETEPKKEDASSGVLGKILSGGLFNLFGSARESSSSDVGSNLMLPRNTTSNDTGDVSTFMVSKYFCCKSIENLMLFVHSS